MSNVEQISANNILPIQELARFKQPTNGSKLMDPEGTLLTDANNDILRFNGYYGLGITTGVNKGKEGAFFTIDTNMYVTTENNVSTPKYYLQFILSMDGKTAVKIPFTGTFTKQSNGDYLLEQTAKGVGGLNQVSLNLTFSRSEGNTTAKFTGEVTIVAPGQGVSQVNGSTYNNPILPTTYLGTYYDKAGVETMEICKDHVLNYRDVGGDNLQRIESYKFDLNMYVFSFVSPADSNANVSLVMGTAPASGLVCGDLRTIGSNAPTQRGLSTIKSPVKPPKVVPSDINLKSNKLAPFSAYYPTPTAKYPDAFVAIQANRIPVVGDVDMYEVMIGVSTDGKTSTVYNFDKTMSFDETTNTLTIPNPEYVKGSENSSTPDQPKDILSISFTRQYIAEGKSGHLIKLEGSIMGAPTITAYTPFNLIPLDGFTGATLKNNKGETLVVNSNNEVTYKGKQVGEYHPQNILYVPIMYILEFTNPEPPKSDVAGMEYKVVCSFGTDAEQGLACIVTEYSLRNGKVVDEAISYYHSVPKQS